MIMENTLEEIKYMNMAPLYVALSEPEIHNEKLLGIKIESCPVKINTIGLQDKVKEECSDSEDGALVLSETCSSHSKAKSTKSPFRNKLQAAKRWLAKYFVPVSPQSFSAPLSEIKKEYRKYCQSYDMDPVKIHILSRLIQIVFPGVKGRGVHNKKTHYSGLRWIGETTREVKSEDAPREVKEEERPVTEKSGDLKDLEKSFQACCDSAAAKLSGMIKRLTERKRLALLLKSVDHSNWCHKEECNAFCIMFRALRRHINWPKHNSCSVIPVYQTLLRSKSALFTSKVGGACSARRAIRFGSGEHTTPAGPYRFC